MAEVWALLPKSASGGIPLLYRYASSSTGYELMLTDLTHLWSEKLDSKQIIRRATESSTTIDPGEDREQFELLLSKIRDAFLSKEGSLLTLMPDKGKSERLILRTETQLPEPFSPLRWSFRLGQLPSLSVTEHVVLPLIEAARFHEAQISSLKGLMEEKDWAIGKLLEKLEIISIDLDTIFPGQRFSRTGPTSNVRGMSIFDEKRWAERFTTKDPLSRVGASISRSLGDSQSSKDIISACQKWWSSLGVRSQQHGEPKEAESNAADEVVQGTEFEATSSTAGTKTYMKEQQRRRQEVEDTESSPESLISDIKHAKRGQVKRRRASSSLVDSSEADVEPTRQRRTLSMLGGPKGRVKHHKPAVRKPSSGSEAEETASGDERSHIKRLERREDDERTDFGDESDKRAKRVPASRKGGLGKLGGKGANRKTGTKAKSASDSEADSTNSEAESRHEHTPTKKQGLGIVGGKKKAEIRREISAIDETATASEAGSEREIQLPKSHAGIACKEEEEPSRKNFGETKRQENIEKPDSLRLQEENKDLDKVVGESRHEDVQMGEKPSQPIRAPVMPKKKRKF
ncbi:hypothetical protein KEM54_006859 [Ascosphaera aggregata]|nr:hypothetical protein KEM54_006859 [Ascosphaera aggregata]